MALSTSRTTRLVEREAGGRAPQRLKRHKMGVAGAGRAQITKVTLDQS